MKIRRYQIFFAISIFIYVSVFVWELLLVARDYDQQLAVNTAGMAMDGFFNIQFGGVSVSMYLQTIMLIVTVGCGTTLYVYAKNTKMFINFQQRTNYGGFLHRGLKKSFFVALFISLGVSALEILLLSIFVHPLNPTMNEKITESNAMHYALNDHTIGNLITYVGLSAIGWGIFAMFVFSVGLFVKKTAIFMFLPVILGNLLIFIPGFLAALTGAQSNIVFQMILLPSLISPGQVGFGGTYHPAADARVLMLVSAIFYLSLAMILTKFWEARMKKTPQE